MCFHPKYCAVHVNHCHFTEEVGENNTWTLVSLPQLHMCLSLPSYMFIKNVFHCLLEYSFLSLIFRVPLPLSLFLFCCQMYWLVSKGRKSVFAVRPLSSLRPRVPYPSHLLLKGKPMATDWYGLLHMRTHSIQVRAVMRCVKLQWKMTKLKTIILFSLSPKLPDSICTHCNCISIKLFCIFQVLTKDL